MKCVSPTVGRQDMSTLWRTMFACAPLVFPSASYAFGSSESCYHPGRATVFEVISGKAIKQIFLPRPGKAEDAVPAPKCAPKITAIYGMDISKYNQTKYA